MYIQAHAYIHVVFLIIFSGVFILEELHSIGVSLQDITGELIDCRQAKCAWQSTAQATIKRSSRTCTRWKEVLEADLFQSRLYIAMNNMGKTLL